MAVSTAEAQRASRTRQRTRTVRARPAAQVRPAARAQRNARQAVQLGSMAKQRAQIMSSMMEGAIRQNATPAMQVMARKDKVQLTQYESPHYKQNRTAKFRVSGLGKSGSLDLVALLPVSGHVGLPNAQKWAKSNKYNVVITHADGTRQTLPKVSSTGFVTMTGMNLKLKKGKTVIQAWADGSAGVGGYKAGREVEIHWDGK
jgi:hypothetical protein